MSKKDTKDDKGSKAVREGRDTTDGHVFDAIVVGGGHNGLVNGAYLAKSGLKVLVLERRHLVGGAAITEELWPGFSFTTFSYALSLLRPDIIHELDLVQHGFMPLLMSSTFAPMENGDYLLIGQDHGVNQREIARHSKHDADAYDHFNHDITKVLQALKPLLDAPAPNLFSDDPEEMLALAGLGARFKGLPKDVLHNTVRLLTGSAADFLDDYFESDILRATSPRRRSSGPRSAHGRRGAGSSSCTTCSGSTTGSSAPGHSTREGTAASPRSWAGRPGRSGPRSGWRRPSRRCGPRAGACAVSRSRTARRSTPRSSSRRSIRGGRSWSSSILGSCRPTSWRPSTASASRGPPPRSTSRSTACRCSRRSPAGRTTTAAS